ITKLGKPFTEGQFVKDCILQVANVCPEKAALFRNVNLSMAEHISELSNDIYHHLCQKGMDFSAYSLALDESSDAVTLHSLLYCLFGSTYACEKLF
ncbi:hypothetical protein LDENG_00200130, partial [Lucifuga dentata]